MSDSCVISIDSLKSGSVQKISKVLTPDFFDIHESDLSFEDPVSLMGEIYLTDDDFVFHFDAKTVARMNCIICNKMVLCPLSVSKYYHTEPLAQIVGAHIDLRNLVREALLLELPIAIECNGNCPERATISPYLRKETNENSYFPFNDIKLP